MINKAITEQKPKPVSSENDVEAQIVLFLIENNWIVRRQHSGLFRTPDGKPIRIGEPGMCDWSAMRSSQRQDVWMENKVEYLEVEVKRPGGKLKPAQREYIAKRIHQKIAATSADSLESFQDWYKMMRFAS